MLYIVASSHLIKWFSGINEYTTDLGSNLIQLNTEGVTTGNKQASPVDPIVYNHGNTYNRVIHKMGNIKHINFYVDYMYSLGQLFAVDGERTVSDMLDINSLGDPRKYLNEVIVKLHPEYAEVPKNEYKSEDDFILDKKKTLDKLITIPVNTKELTVEERIRLARQM